MQTNERESVKALKRKLKEVEIQTPFRIIDTLNAYNKKWKGRKFMGGGCTINVSFLGGSPAFEFYIDGESFGELINPQIELALKKTLENNKMYINMNLSQIEKALK